MRVDRAKLAELDSRIAAGEFAAGGWFCFRCQHITELNLDGPIAACVLCGSSWVKWRCPEGTRQAPPAGKVTVREHGVERKAGTVTGLQAHKWFEAMREAVDEK